MSMEFIALNSTITPIPHCQHRFGGGQEEAVAAAPRDEFHRWVSLAVIGFKAQRQFAISLTHSRLVSPIRLGLCSGRNWLVRRA